MPIDETPKPSDFIREAVTEDLKSGRFQTIHTRVPPEPNGYLHIGHSKAICIDFGIAQEFGGKCNLRFDDTNPVKEDVEYVDAIKEDIRWLGFDWEEREFYASDYFDQLYAFAVQLIQKGKAYVDDQTPEEVSKKRGTLTEPGVESPYRNRSAAENLALFERMKNGEFPDGSRVLRAKIDMASGNLNMRDPVLYRILHEPAHHRTGDKWKIYPMYDFAHGQSDSIEGISHSLCSLEYEAHRPLYEWFLKELEIFAPRQMEFARLNINYTVMSKRKLLKLVKEGHVKGWDDPRMPTLCGLRRRGYTPESIREFTARVGVAKNDSIIDVALLEYCLREDLNKRAPRRMGVLHPLKVVIDNYPADAEEELEAANNPADAASGTRKVPFARELFIEQDDFQETPQPKYYRLFPGNEVRLRAAYFVKCVSVEKDAQGHVAAIHCTYDPATRGGDSPDRKVKSTIHWVSAKHAVRAEVRLYDRLFNHPDPDAGDDFMAHINPNSLTILDECYVEPALANAAAGDRFQFERQGYFCADPDTAPGKPVFNLAVALKDTWDKGPKN
ncbi:MAG: glutamine--tRNA ligase/YqeY domain fusion protein [Anaerolineales bacterium]